MSTSITNSTPCEISTPATVIIETPRLELSDFRVEDCDAFHDLFHQLHLSGQEWFNVDAKKRETTQAFFDKIMANQDEMPRHTYRLAIKLKNQEGISKLIGYVSLCDVHAVDDARPDTGILISPLHQGHGYAREARLAIGYFGFHHLKLPKLVCDIYHDNHVSISNVRGMGYRQLHHEDLRPVIIPTTTHKGIQDWFRFHLTLHEFNTVLPNLIDHLTKKHWFEHLPHLADAQEFFKVYAYHGPERLRTAIERSLPPQFGLATK